jgi:hypothetical protein
VTCDLEGSIECLTEYTQPEKPFFYYDSIEDKSSYDASYAYGKILYLAIDFLPCELAYDACNFLIIQHVISVIYSKTGYKILPKVTRTNRYKSKDFYLKSRGLSLLTEENSRQASTT